jgi:imidazolonepropionase-like amidohydrolase
VPCDIQSKEELHKGRENMKQIFKGIRLIDTESGDVNHSGKALVAEDGRVKDWTDRPGPGETCSFEGFFMLPGLIDAHVHLIWEGQPDPNRLTMTEHPAKTAYRAGRSALRSLSGGVTTVRDVGGPDGIPIALARAIREGVASGSRVFAAGRPVAQTGGHVHTMCREADGPQEVRKAVREQVKAGADLIKLMCSGGAYTEGESIHATQLTLEEIRAATEEAHVTKRKVAAHALSEAAIQNCLEGGVDTIEHAALLGEKNILSFKETGAFMVPTIAPYYIMATRGRENGVPEYAVDKSIQVMEHYVTALKKAVSAGIPMALGTDAGSPQLPHPALPYEAWLWWKEAGLDALTILHAATIGGARTLGQDQALGRLMPGCYADFVLYDANPLEDVSVLHFPKAVFQGGQKVAGEGVVWSEPLTRERR